MDLADRIRLFYTNEGIFGHSALSIALQSLEPFSKLSRKYEEVGVNEPEAHNFPVLVFDAIYSAFEKQYRRFFDELMASAPSPAREKLQTELIRYHHMVVRTLESERAKLWEKKPHEAGKAGL